MDYKKNLKGMKNLVEVMGIEPMSVLLEKNTTTCVVLTYTNILAQEHATNTGLFIYKTHYTTTKFMYFDLYG